MQSICQQNTTNTECLTNVVYQTAKIMSQNNVCTYFVRHLKQFHDIFKKDSVYWDKDSILDMLRSFSRNYLNTHTHYTTHTHTHTIRTHTTHTWHHTHCTHTHTHTHTTHTTHTHHTHTTHTPHTQQHTVGHDICTTSYQRDTYLPTWVVKEVIFCVCFMLRGVYVYVYVCRYVYDV